MKKLMITIIITACLNAITFGQIYGIPGSELNIVSGNAGLESVQYDIFISDEYPIDDLDVRIKAHVAGDEFDSLSMDFEATLEIPPLADLYPALILYDHNCYTSNFNSIDIRFSDEEDEHLNEICETNVLCDVTNADRLGDPIDEVLFGEEPLTIFDDLTTNQHWRIFISFKPFFNDWPEKNVIIDSLFLIFNDSEEIGEVDEIELSIEHELQNQSIHIYPNPIMSGNSVVVDYTTNNYDLSVYDLTGKLILFQKNNSAKTILSTDGIPKGTYILEINDNGIISREKLVIL